MTNMIIEFMNMMLQRAMEDYSQDSKGITRLFKKEPTVQLFLSPDLFERLRRELKEDELEFKCNQLIINGVSIVEGSHPKSGTNFTFDIGGLHYGYNPQHYGLQ